MTRWQWIWVLLWIGVGAFGASAQSEDAPIDNLIERDTPVFETLTEIAFFDLWRFYAEVGERYQVTMTGADGLAPLIGVRGGSGDVFASSNQLSDGTTREAVPDSEAVLTFTVQQSGELTVIATRAYGQDGTTTGSYRLLLTLLEASPESDPYLDVSFRCRSELADSAAFVSFGDASEEGQTLRLTVWASFRPVIRIGDGVAPDGESGCILPDDDVNAMQRGIISGRRLPVGTEGVEAMVPHTAMFEIPVRTANGVIGLTLGSLDGLDGVFVARIDGLSLESAEDSDQIILRHGPLAADGLLRLIAQPSGISRLDMQVAIDDSLDGVIACEDWGLRSCGLDDWRSTDMAYNNDILRFDRLDAAVEMATGNPDPVNVAVLAGNPNATGEYTIWVIGKIISQLP